MDDLKLKSHVAFTSNEKCQRIVSPFDSLSAISRRKLKRIFNCTVDGIVLLLI